MAHLGEEKQFLGLEMERQDSGVHTIVKRFGRDGRRKPSSHSSPRQKRLSKPKRKLMPDTARALSAACRTQLP